DRHRLAVVDAPHLAPKNRTRGYCGELHARHHRVDAELGVAVYFLWCVEALGRGSDDREVLGIFEHDLVRNRLFSRRLDESAIVELTPCWRDLLAFFGVA